MRVAHNKLPEEVIIKRCDELALRYVRSVAENSRTYVYFTCDKHERFGEQRMAWYHLRNAVCGCSYCSGKHKDSIELQRELDEIGVPVAILGEYVSARSKILYRCNLCGLESYAVPNSLLNKQACPRCGDIRRAEKRKKTTERFIDELSNIQPNIEIVSEYTGAHRLIRCKCKVDGYEWGSYPANLLNMSAGCAICNNSISMGESAVMRYLEDHHIKFHRDYSFDDCRMIHKLRFDFYIPDMRIAIEFDGRQHFEEVPYFHHNHDELVTSRQRDELKNQYCTDHDITMIRIPYYDIKRIGEILDTRIEPLKNTA